MLDLKAKLLAAGVVTAEQVQKVEDDQAVRRERDSARREEQRRRREEGGNGGGGGDRQARGPRGPGGHGGPKGPPGRDGPPGRRPPGGRDGGPRGNDGAQRPQGAQGEGRAEARPEGAGKAPRARDTRSFKERRADEALEKRARREHEWTESLRWRERKEDLKAAGLSDQYAATRGWVMKTRIDNKAISEAAEKFHFTTYAGALSHLTVEPDVQALLKDGGAGIVAFMGYNGIEHGVVPVDVARDIHDIKVEWLRHLIGITDLVPAPIRPAHEVADEAEQAAQDAAAAEGDGSVVEGDNSILEAGAEGHVEAQADVASTDPESQQQGDAVTVETVVEAGAAEATRD